MEDYFKKILQAQVYEVAKKTPLEKANNLSKALKNNIYLKREDLQDVFSFKIRGAFNKMRQIPQSQLANGVITSSAGNHAQGVALSAMKLNCSATILMPITTPLVKVKAVNTIRVKGKVKRFRGIIGKRAEMKKAIVSLADGQSIDINAGF